MKTICIVLCLICTGFALRASSAAYLENLKDFGQFKILPGAFKWKVKGAAKYQSLTEENGPKLLKITTPKGKSLIYNMRFKKGELPVGKFSKLNFSVKIKGDGGIVHIWFVTHSKLYFCHFFSLRGNNNWRKISLSRLKGKGDGKFELSDLKTIYIKIDASAPSEIQISPLIFKYNTEGVALDKIKVKKIYPASNASNVKAITDFVIYRTKQGVPKEKTSVKLSYDTRNIYVRAKLSVADTKKMKALKKKRDSALWEDDDFEMFLDINNDNKTHYQFIVNSIGTVCDIFYGYDMVKTTIRNQIAWNSGLSATTIIKPNYWTVKMTLPANDIKFKPAPGKYIGAQFARMDQQTKEAVSWSPTQRFPDTSRFAYLYFCESKPTTIKITNVVLNKDTNGKDCYLAVTLKNNIPGDFVLTATIKSPGKTKTLKKQLSLSGGSKTYGLKFSKMLGLEGRYRIVVSVVSVGRKSGDLYAAEADIIIPSNIRYGDNVICPFPKNIVWGNNRFSFKPKMKILINADSGQKIQDIAKYLSDEIFDYFGIRLAIEKNRKISKKTIKISFSSTEKSKLTGLQKLKKEGYKLAINKNTINLGSRDSAGLFYSVVTLSQIIRNACVREQNFLPTCKITDWPDSPVRAINHWWGSIWTPEHINFDYDYFKNFIIKRLLAENKINFYAFRCGNGIVYKNPKLKLFCSERPMMSIDQYAQIAQYSRDHFIEFVPALHSGSHCHWLTSYRRDLRDGKDFWQGDTLNPEYYEILLSAFDELIKAAKPKYFDIGQDEWWHYSITPATRNGRAQKDIFKDQVLKLYNYFKQRGIKTVMTSDMLLKSHNGIYPTSKYKNAGAEAINTADVLSQLPKDILLLDWSEQFFPGTIAKEKKQGFKVMFFGHGTRKVEEKVKKQLNGYGNWLYGNPTTFNRKPSASRYRLNSFYQILATANYAWNFYNSNYLATKDLMKYYGMNLMAQNAIRPNPMGGRIIKAFNLKSYANANYQNGKSGLAIANLLPGDDKYGFIPLQIMNAKQNGNKSCIVLKNDTLKNIKIERKCSSIFFFQTAILSVATENKFWQRLKDKKYPVKGLKKGQRTFTIGFYKINYEDGSQALVPINYGQNIANWLPQMWSMRYLFETRYLWEGKSSTKKNCCVYLYEWVNPNPMKKIKSISIRAIDPDCALALLAISTRNVKIKGK